MKYIIVGYTNDIDIKSNTTKIRYLAFSDGFAPAPYWTENITEAIYFTNRAEAQYIIDICCFDNCITYGIVDGGNNE